MLNLFELGTYSADAPLHHKVVAHRFAKIMVSGGGGAEVHEDLRIPDGQSCCSTPPGILSVR